MKKPTNAPVIPLFNPALPPINRLLDYRQMGTFCQLKFQEMGAELPEWAISHNVRVQEAMRLSSEPLHIDPANRTKRNPQGENFTLEFIQSTFWALGYPTDVVWVKHPESKKPEPIFVLGASFVKEFRQEEKALKDPQPQP